ncbi:zinc-ribbon domain-containing protein [Methylobacterium sp. sgz302541]|uniref:zinc-ribbon domain-containing protein n=1 Tax=unclassified Methylobacterium TaxID=2615210 RepID=UPI003D32FC4E
MLITCPRCSSSFRIDVDRVGPEGRSVRCGACREPWFVSPADVLTAQAAELGAAADPEPAAAPSEPDAELAAWLAPPLEPAPWESAVLDNVPPPPARPMKPNARGNARSGRPAEAGASIRKGFAGLSPATAAGLAILAAIPLACLARVPVVRALPQTAGLYARIGLLVNLRGLELRDVAAFRNPADAGRPAELVVEGDLVGTARGDSPVPGIEVSLRDAAGQVVATYPVSAPRSVLGEAETVRFRGRFPDPPAGGRSIEVRFAAMGARDAAKGEPAHGSSDKAEAGHAPAPGKAAQDSAHDASAHGDSAHGHEPAPAPASAASHAH